MSEQSLTHVSLMTMITHGQTVCTTYPSVGVSCMVLSNGWGMYVSDVGDRLVVDLKRPGSNSRFDYCSITKVNDPLEARLYAKISAQTHSHDQASAAMPLFGSITARKIFRLQ